MKGVLDTNILIEMYDRGNVKLLEHLLEKYELLLIPWIVMYEYLYGHKYLGRDIKLRKLALEKLGRIVWITQEILMKALKIDISLRKQGCLILFQNY